MVAKLVAVALLALLAVAAVLVAGFRYLDRQAERRHERRLARAKRDHDLLMEDLESEGQQETETERE